MPQVIEVDEPRLLDEQHLVHRRIAIVAGQRLRLAEVHFRAQREELRSGYNQLLEVTCHRAQVEGEGALLWQQQPLFILRLSHLAFDKNSRYFFAESKQEFLSVLSERSYRESIIRRHIEGDDEFDDYEPQALRQDQDYLYTGPRELRGPAQWSVFVFTRGKQGVYKLDRERSAHIYELDVEEPEDEEPDLRRLFDRAVAKRALGTKSSTVLKPGRKSGGEVEIRCRWSRTWVHPLHNSRWPPAHQPSDAPDDWPSPPQCSVFIEIETRNLADGTPVEVSVHHAPPLIDEPGDPPLRATKQNRVHVIDGLFVQYGRVRRFADAYIEDQNGDPVEVVLDDPDILWRSWKYPYFYFRVTVFAARDDREALTCHSPFAHWSENYRGDCLQLVGWHVAIGDSGLGDASVDCRELARPMTKVDTVLHRTLRCGAFIEGNRPQAAEWGSYVRNSYSAVQVGHGRLFLRVARADGGIVNLKRAYELNLPEPIDTGISLWDRNAAIRADCDDRGIRRIALSYETWTPRLEDIDDYKSLFVLGHQPEPGFNDRHTIMDAGVVGDHMAIPSVPRYLMIIATCRSAGAPDLAEAFLARGTRWVIGFRSALASGNARAATVEFYERWRELDYRPTRDAIMQCFDEAFLQPHPEMKPVLFGNQEWDIEAGIGELIGEHFSRHWEPEPAPEDDQQGGFTLRLPGAEHD